MIKFFVKRGVLLTTKDFLFILASLAMFIFIFNAFAEQARIGTYFLYVLIIMDYIYAVKIIDNYKMQKNEKPQKNNPKVEIPIKKYYEA